PWLLAEQLRGIKPARALKTVIASSALSLAPICIAYLPFWAGAATFAGPRSQYALTVDPSMRAHAAAVSGWFAGHGLPPWLATVALGLEHELTFIVLLGACLLLLGRYRSDEKYLVAWAALSIVLSVF